MSEQALTHGNTVPGRTDTTSGWTQPDTKLSGRPEFTGETFNAIREKANAARAGVVQQTTKTPAERLYSEMLGHRLFNLDAIKFLVRELSSLIETNNRLEAEGQELKNQMSLLRGLPPHMKNTEQR
ncbi:MAG: hypothetical protein WB711_08310 [Terriglobales bacterium]